MIERQDEFTECIGEVRTKLTIKDLMERTVDEMKDDEMLWGRFYNKEEEEARIREGIIAEERMEAKKEAREEAREEVKKEMVIKMNEENIQLDTISKVTELTIEEIQNILNN